MTLRDWHIAVFVVLLGFLAWAGCSHKPPTPTAQNLDRYTLKLIAADGHTVLAEAKFGERARGAKIICEDSQTSMVRGLGTDFVLDYLNGEAEQCKR